MASDEEEDDLHVLRTAVLASMKAKLKQKEKAINSGGSPASQDDIEDDPELAALRTMALMSKTKEKKEENKPQSPALFNARLPFNPQQQGQFGPRHSQFGHRQPFGPRNYQHGGPRPPWGMRGHPPPGPWNQENGPPPPLMGLQWRPGMTPPMPGQFGMMACPPQQPPPFQWGGSSGRSNLILIQPVNLDEENPLPPPPEANKPVKLQVSSIVRPQDKLMPRAAAPEPKPKATGKFTRYENSDSEEEEEEEEPVNKSPEPSSESELSETEANDTKALDTKEEPDKENEVETEADQDNKKKVNNCAGSSSSSKASSTDSSSSSSSNSDSSSSSSSDSESSSASSTTRKNKLKKQKHSLQSTSPVNVEKSVVNDTRSKEKVQDSKSNHSRESDDVNVSKHPNSDKERNVAEKHSISKHLKSSSPRHKSNSRNSDDDRSSRTGRTKHIKLTEKSSSKMDLRDNSSPRSERKQQSRNIDNSNSRTKETDSLSDKTRSENRRDRSGRDSSRDRINSKDKNRGRCDNRKHEVDSYYQDSKTGLKNQDSDFQIRDKVRYKDNKKQLKGSNHDTDRDKSCDSKLRSDKICDRTKMKPGNNSRNSSRDRTVNSKRNDDSQHGHGDDKSQHLRSKSSKLLSVNDRERNRKEDKVNRIIKEHKKSASKNKLREGKSSLSKADDLIHSSDSSFGDDTEIKPAKKRVDLKVEESDSDSDEGGRSKHIKSERNMEDIERERRMRQEAEREIERENRRKERQQQELARRKNRPVDVNTKQRKSNVNDRKDSYSDNKKQYSSHEKNPLPASNRGDHRKKGFVTESKSEVIQGNEDISKVTSCFMESKLQKNPSTKQGIREKLIDEEQKKLKGSESSFISKNKSSLQSKLSPPNTDGKSDKSNIVSNDSDQKKAEILKEIEKIDKKLASKSKSVHKTSSFVGENEIQDISKINQDTTCKKTKRKSKESSELEEECKPREKSKSPEFSITFNNDKKPEVHNVKKSKRSKVVLEEDINPSFKKKNKTVHERLELNTSSEVEYSDLYNHKKSIHERLGQIVSSTVDGDNLTEVKIRGLTTKKHRKNKHLFEESSSSRKVIKVGNTGEENNAMLDEYDDEENGDLRNMLSRRKKPPSVVKDMDSDVMAANQLWTSRNKSHAPRRHITVYDDDVFNEEDERRGGTQHEKKHSSRPKKSKRRISSEAGEEETSEIEEHKLEKRHPNQSFSTRKLENQVINSPAKKIKLKRPADQKDVVFESELDNRIKRIKEKNAAILAKQKQIDAEKKKFSTH